jgi:hypothetical protein
MALWGKVFTNGAADEVCDPFGMAGRPGSPGQRPEKGEEIIGPHFTPAGPDALTIGGLNGLFAWKALVLSRIIFGFFAGRGWA